jgi:hypothetical protein
MKSLKELSLGERVKEYLGYETDPIDPKDIERDLELAKEEQRAKELEEAEARDLRTALAAAARHLLPYLRLDLDEVRGRLARAATQGNQYETAYWSGHLERLLGIIRNMEDARP